MQPFITDGMNMMLYMQAVRSWQAVIFFGIDSNYLDAYGFQITKGRGFSEKDFTANRKVVLLDKTTATALFPDGNVIGKIIEG